MCIEHPIDEPLGCTALAQIRLDLNLGRPMYYQPDYGTRYDYHGRPYYAPRYAPVYPRYNNYPAPYYQYNHRYDYPGYYGR